MDRAVLFVLLESYTEDELGGEKRVYLKLKPKLAPIRAAVFPLLKNKPELVARAQSVYHHFKKKENSLDAPSHFCAFAQAHFTLCVNIA